MSSAAPLPGFTYARSADGTDIAYVRLGSGPTVVIVPPVPFSNVSGDWSVPLVRQVYSRLAADFELLLYDGRGTGASQRSVSDLSTDALTADLQAVLDDAGVEAATLLAMYLAAVPAVTLAARRPDRVHRLVLFGAVAHGVAALDRPGTGALLSLIDEDWELFTRSAALDWMGWGVGESGLPIPKSIISSPAARAAAFMALTSAKT